MILKILCSDDLEKKIIMSNNVVLKQIFTHILAYMKVLFVLCLQIVLLQDFS
jgi:hypothetical protein